MICSPEVRTVYPASYDHAVSRQRCIARLVAARAAGVGTRQELARDQPAIARARPTLPTRAVRQAMSYAIDRQRFIDVALSGLVGAPRDLPWPSSSPAYEPTKNNVCAFDLDKAKSLLATSGVGGFTTEIAYQTIGPVQVFAQLVEMLQADLARVGVATTMQALDTATFTNAAVKATFKGLAIGQPGGFSFQDATSGLATGTFGASNPFSGFKDEAYYQLVNSASAETDQAKRKQLYSRINDVILDQAFTLTVSSLLQTSIALASVHVPARAPSGGGSGGFKWAEVWLE
jgi:peptide/nickel transport system substrate-binding protein